MTREMASRATPKLAGDMLKHGQELHRKKKYQDSLQCFNHVISLNDSNLSIALDNRIATHIKLGDLKAALCDGRRMIKLDKARSVGYLRTGRILRLLGESESALGIYKYGLGNVPVSDANFELLRYTYDEMVKLTKTADPLKVLPLEVATMVMRYLTFPNIVELLRVSKLWSLLLGSMPMIWSHFDFSSANKQVSMPAIRQYVQRSGGAVTQASIHFFKEHHANTLKYITSNCKALNRIDILSGYPTMRLLKAASSALMLKSLIISRKCPIDLDYVSYLLEFCTNLDRAEFHYCNTSKSTKWGGDLSKIRSLTITNGQLTPDTGERLWLPSLFERIPKVQYLSLTHWGWPAGPARFDFDFSSLKNLQSLDLSHSGRFCFPLLPISVETLDLSSCIYDLYGVSESKARLKATHLPALTGLSVAGDHYTTDPTVLSLLKANKGNLKSLNIKGCHNLTPTDYYTLIREGFLDTVTQLGLGVHNIGDEIIESIATNLSHLKILDLDSARVTGIGVKALALQKNRTLERLILKNCEYVSVDAVEYARARGIIVHFSSPDASWKKKNNKIAR